MTTADNIDGSDWTEGLARVGLVARGFVYVIFGLIAVRLATAGGTDGEEASASGAFGELAEKPFGTWLVGLVALGLAAWALSCLIAALTGRNGSTPGPNDGRERLINVGRALVNLLLAGAAVRVLLQDQPGEEASSGGETEGEVTARLMDVKAGQLLIGVVGVVVIGVGLFRLYKAVRQSHLDHVDLTCMGPRLPQGLLKVLAMVGYLGRGLLITLVGVVLTRAAVTHEADSGKGIDGALRELSGGGPGSVLLVAIALGVTSFGVWVLIEARCRRSDTEDPDSGEPTSERAEVEAQSSPTA